MNVKEGDANASRRKLANMGQVDARLEQLEEALEQQEGSTPTNVQADSDVPPSRPNWMAKTLPGKLEQQRQ